MESSLMSWIIFFNPKENTLKALCTYLCFEFVKKVGDKKWGYLVDIECT